MTEKSSEGKLTSRPETLRRSRRHGAARPVPDPLTRAPAFRYLVAARWDEKNLRAVNKPLSRDNVTQTRYSGPKHRADLREGSGTLVGARRDNSGH